MSGLYLNGYQAYKLFMAVNFHFKQKKYDIFARKGRVKFSQESFDSRNDKNFFHRLGSEYRKGDLADYFMANNMAGCTHISEYTDYNWREWKSKMHRIEYIFEEDLKKLQFLVVKHEIKFNDLFTSITGALPMSLQLYNGGHINIETMCIIDRILQGDIFSKFDEQVRDKFIYPGIMLKLRKYQPWLKLDLGKLKILLVNYVK